MAKKHLAEPNDRAQGYRRSINAGVIDVKSNSYGLDGVIERDRLPSEPHIKVERSRGNRPPKVTVTHGRASADAVLHNAQRAMGRLSFRAVTSNNNLREED